MWFDGSRPVQNWAPSGNFWVASGWTARFDASPTYTRGASDGTAANWTFVNRAHPMAAHPDQVWIDGRAVTQVQGLSQLRPGTFFADYATQKLYLGTNPAGHSVRASDISKAATVQGAGSIVRGVGFQRFAPSIPDMGAVTAEREGVTIENVTVIDNAGTGIHAVGANITFRNITLARNGMLGGSASTADNFKATGVLSYGNNTELFNQSPVSGGFKVTRSRSVRFSDSLFVRNSGPGLWMDESVYNGVVTHNDMVANKGHGLIMEISAKFVVANNVITGNSGNGIKLNDTSNVDVWNNTLSGNGRNLNIVQDTRRASNRSTPGHDPRQAFPDPTMTWITSNITVRNNIVAGGSGNCLLCVEDYSHQFSAEQLKISANGNVYQRPSAGSPAWAVVWSRGAGNPAVHTSVAGFKSGTGQESSHVFLDGRPALNGWQPTAEIAAKDASVAQPLSGAVAGLLGKSPGVRHLGAWRP
ncbi:right-handed parallel beta-helix repeat-containing protein [Arthrobacter sp. CG_A4]|uniref:right-handed parallel beta-helix repeat-containing protein n=1 Tax=Arthrobacter sp. CG_A4 TaxID=3071706 RepID=UPI002E0E4C64